jgi:hypothetical protein
LQKGAKALQLTFGCGCDGVLQAVFKYPEEAVDGIGHALLVSRRVGVNGWRLKGLT